MISDDLGNLIATMIDDYESYTGLKAFCIAASPDLMQYLLAKTPNHYITLGPTGLLSIAGVPILSDPEMNRGKIEIR